MRGRTVPILNSASLQSASSYVQINIYDTNLKALRKRGVDVKHFLQHVGCRSVVMDVPIVYSEVKRPSRFASRRLNKSFGGFTMQAEDSLLEESQQCLKRVGCNKNEHDIHDMSLDLDSGHALPAEESNASNAAFNESVIDEVRRGPLTSTPMVVKTASFRSFISAKGTLDDAPTNGVGAHSSTGLIVCDKQMHPQSEKEVLGTTAAESSFAAFSADVMKGMKTVNGDEISGVDPASFCICSIGDDEVYLNESENPEEFCDPVGNYENSSVQLVKDCTDSAPTTAPKVCHIGTTVPEATELHASDLNVKSSPPTVDDESAVEEPPRLVVYEDDVAHPRAASAAEDAKEHQVTACKNSSSSNRKPNRRKRVRPASPRDDSHNGNGEANYGTRDGSVDEEESCANRVTQGERVSGAALTSGDQSYTCQFPYCNTTLLWRPRYGKNRLVDHVRIHWGKEVKQCKLCGFKADCFRKIRHHHQVLHSDVAYEGSLSLETKEDIKELVELWKKCFPTVGVGEFCDAQIRKFRRDSELTSEGANFFSSLLSNELL